MARCNDQHPEQEHRHCAMDVGTHRFHTDLDGTWANEAYVPPRPKATKKTKGLLANFLGGADVPAGAAQAWNQDGWAQDTYSTVVAWLRTRTEPFTTAEHVWPLIPAPQEKRAMSLVVSRLLREHKIVEEGATRLKGVYTSQDGVEFKENKFVPIYRSRICQAADLS